MIRSRSAAGDNWTILGQLIDVDGDPLDLTGAELEWQLLEAMPLVPCRVCRALMVICIPGLRLSVCNRAGSRRRPQEPYQKRCKRCRKAFSARRPEAMYCGMTCRNADNYSRQMKAKRGRARSRKQRLPARAPVTPPSQGPRDGPGHC